LNQPVPNRDTVSRRCTRAAVTPGQPRETDLKSGASMSAQPHRRPCAGVPAMGDTTSRPPLGTARPIAPNSGTGRLTTVVHLDAVIDVGMRKRASVVGCGPATGHAPLVGPWPHRHRSRTPTVFGETTTCWPRSWRTSDTGDSIRSRARWLSGRTAHTSCRWRLKA